jgi:hypothetical protein
VAIWQFCLIFFSSNRGRVRESRGIFWVYSLYLDLLYWGSWKRDYIHGRNSISDGVFPSCFFLVSCFLFLPCDRSFLVPTLRTTSKNLLFGFRKKNTLYMMALRNLDILFKSNSGLGSGVRKHPLITCN